MMRETSWIFDLDNTLHNAMVHVFPRINRAMTEYIQQHLEINEADANALRRHYWQRYGATLLGLIRHRTHALPAQARRLRIPALMPQPSRSPATLYHG